MQCVGKSYYNNNNNNNNNNLYCTKMKKVQFFLKNQKIS